MPILVGLACFIMAVLSTSTIMPLVQLDDFYKGIIKIAIWVMSFVLPMEYLHKKAKREKLKKKSTKYDLSLHF
jgi:hypothetical protein